MQLFGLESSSSFSRSNKVAFLKLSAAATTVANKLKLQQQSNWVIPPNSALHSVLSSMGTEEQSETPAAVELSHFQEDDHPSAEDPSVKAMKDLAAHCKNRCLAPLLWCPVLC